MSTITIYLQYQTFFKVKKNTLRYLQRISSSAMRLTDIRRMKYSLKMSNLFVEIRSYNIFI